MDSSTQAALDEIYVKVFVAFDIQLANARVCLSDGLPEVTFPIGSENVTFINSDPIFGVVSSCEGWSDGLTDEAPSTSLTITPIEDAAIPYLCDPRNQTGPINIYFGLIDDATGAVIGNPELLYAGEYDTGTLKASADTREVDINVISAWERFFNVDKGFRLNLRYQQSIHPNENGLKFMVTKQDVCWWGSDQINGATPTAAPTSALATKLNKST
jgi:hypothetical protein